MLKHIGVDDLLCIKQLLLRKVFSQMLGFLELVKDLDVFITWQVESIQFKRDTTHGLTKFTGLHSQRWFTGQEVPKVSSCMNSTSLA